MLPKIETVLYASDLGDNARPALRMAYKLAELSDARLVLLHVIEEVAPHVALMIDTYLPEENFEELQRRGRQQVLDTMSKRLTDFCQDELGGAIPESRLEQRVEEGYPPRTILAVADELDADVIVLGAHAHSTVGELVIGSVAHKLMHQTRRPLMLVPVEA